MVVGFVQTSSWISFFCSGGGRSSRFVAGSWIARVTCPSARRALAVLERVLVAKRRAIFVARGNGRASRYTLSKDLLATDIICA